MQAAADSWVPGYRFKAGRLLVFERDRITLVEAWPEPAAAEKRRGGSWRPIHPEFRLVRPYRRPAQRKVARGPRQQMLPLELPPAAPTRSELADQKRRAFDALRFALPREVARAIERFPCGQFTLLLTLRAAAVFLELLAANPALACCLAHELRQHQRIDDAPRLVARKQPEIAAFVGFPDTPAATRTLRKVVPESVSPASARQLRQALRDDDARQKLAHLPSLNAGVIRLLGDARLCAAATPTLLEEVAHDRSERYRAAVADLLLDVLELETVLHDRAPPAFASVERLRRVHQELSERYVAQRASGLLDHRFPEPPIAGTATIVPLTEPRQLIAEGLRQHNCVASYAPAVARGDTFVYRVERPQRATLAIRRDGTGGWYCSELRSACNGLVSRATEEAVQHWLDERIVSA